MLTVFDRYVLRGYWHAFVIAFLATLGLYVVIDGFTNIDGFQERHGDRGTLAVLGHMAVYYSYQSSAFFDRVGPILSVVAAMIVLALLHWQSEVHPLLAAGVPAFRLAIPLVIGAVLINAVIVFNRECIIPHIAPQLQAPRGETEADAQDVEPVYDFRTGIRIGGAKLYPISRRLVNAEFTLPVPAIVQELTTLKAGEAVFLEESAGQPAGWLLRGISPPYNDLALTEVGRRVVIPQENGSDVFVVTDISFDQLYRRNASLKYVSTRELMRRIRNPAFGMTSMRAQTLLLHDRLTRPVLNLIAVVLTVPFVLRRETSGLLINLAVCTGVLVLLMGLTEACHYLGQVNLLRPDLASWLPIVLAGTFCAWSADLVQT